MALETLIWGCGVARRKPWEADDEFWAVIEPLLSKVERRVRHPGRKRHSDRLVFQGILFGRRPGLLAVRQDDLPSLRTLAAGLERDREAVIAGLTLPWSSGVVEGHGNRIKMLKRQMFGRAGFNLLRRRVLIS